MDQTLICNRLGGFRRFLLTVCPFKSSGVSLNSWFWCNYIFFKHNPPKNSRLISTTVINSHREMHCYVPNRSQPQLLQLHTLALSDGHCGFVVHGCGFHTPDFPTPESPMRKENNEVAAKSDDYVRKGTADEEKLCDQTTFETHSSAYLGRYYRSPL